jgi:hypothetical protein
MTRRADLSAAAAKENAPMMLSSSEDRRSGGVQGGEVFVAVDDGFGVDLEELLRATAYIIGKSRGGIVYRVVSVHGVVVAVRRLSEPYDSDGADGCRRRAFEAEAARDTPNVACLSGAPAVYAPPSSSTPCFDEVPREDTGRRENTIGRALRPALPSFPRSDAGIAGDTTVALRPAKSVCECGIREHLETA